MARQSQVEHAEAILHQGTLTDADITVLSQFNGLREFVFVPGTTFPPHTFVRLARLRWLQFLSFEGSAFSVQDMQDLGRIPTLRSLIFQQCQFGDAEFQHFTAPPRLDRLWLEGSQITDASLPHIAAMASVTWLSLIGTAITDAGLAQLTTMTQLKILYLANTAITDRGLLHLTTLPHLTTLGPRPAAVTPDGWVSFRAAQRAERYRRRYGMALLAVDPAAVAEATQRLHAFIEAMHIWGLQAIAIAAQIPPPPRNTTAVAEAWQQMQEELVPIITAFCTPQRRVRGKPEYFSVSTPPEYDPATFVIHTIVQPDPRTIVIGTEEALQEEYEYVLKRRGSQWFIDSRKCWSDGRWQPGYL